MTTKAFSPSRLDVMKQTLSGYVERNAVTGLVTLLSRNGETHVEAAGAQSIGGAPMQQDTIFRIASLTKPIVAVAAMILVEECRLRLDDPIDKFLPELEDRQVMKDISGPLEDTIPAERPITMRDLITLRLGLGFPMEAPQEAPIWNKLQELQLLQGPPRPQSLPAPDEWLQKVAQLPLMYQPGQRWMYDIGLDLLGVLISRAAAQPLEDFLQERIFQPLGMKDTAFYVPAEKIHRLATSYEPNPEIGQLDVYDEAEGGEWSRPPKFASGSGGLVSTVDDYHAFTQMLLNFGTHGNTRILSRPTVQAMTTPQLSPEQKIGADIFLGERNWGFGMSVFAQRNAIAAVPGRFGWDGGMGTSWYSTPTEDLTGILLTQTNWTSPEGPEICQDFWTLAFAAIEN